MASTTTSVNTDSNGSKAHPGSNCGTPPSSVAAGQKCSAAADCSGANSCCLKFAKEADSATSSYSPVSVCFADKASKSTAFTAVAPISTDQASYLGDTSKQGYPVSDCGTVAAGHKCSSSAECSGTDSCCSPFAKTVGGSNSTDKACFVKGSFKSASFAVDS